MRQFSIAIVCGLLAGLWSVAAQADGRHPAHSHFSDAGQVRASGEIARAQSPDSMSSRDALQAAWQITAAEPRPDDGQTMMLTEQRSGEPEEVYVDDDSVFVGGGDACACGPSAVCEVCCPTPFAHGSGGFGEWLYLQPSDVDFAYAIPRNGLAPNGEVGIADPGYESAFRAGFNVALDGCSSIVASYSLFEHHVGSQISTDTPDNIASLVIHPNTASAASTFLLVQTDYDIDFDLIDVDYRRVLYASPTTAVNYLAGVRYGSLEQEAEVRHTLTAFTPTTVNTDIDFEGAGLRLGIDGEHRVCCKGLMIYGRGVFNILAGNFQADYVQTNAFNLEVEALSRLENDRIVPILEYELGFGWVSRQGVFRVSAGYYFAAWYNTLTTPTWIQAVQGANFVDVDETLTFNGFVSRAEVRW